jgi:ribokinase
MSIAVLGIFVADATFRTDRLPRMGETVLGKAFALGPGGKGSNQAVGCARLGAEVTMLTRLGRDSFADMARALWQEAGVTPGIVEDDAANTGAACILVNDDSGDNAIVVAPGAAGRLTPADIDSWAAVIGSARLFLTQLESPLDATFAALRTARAAGVRTILNPAPAAPLPEGMLALCDLVTPNESEAEALTGVGVADLAGAERAAGALLKLGAGAAVVTLGENGAFYRDRSEAFHVPRFDAGPVAETTGAGDAFNAGLAVALDRGLSPRDAVRFGCATAAISVTRPGAANSMPLRDEVEDLLSRAS